MYLERLEISGFKSFANKAILEFPKPQGKKRGIAAIVGPNGSGKSNVADSIRWSLGEQSIKMLRGKKAEDVIFSGSDKRARLGMAEVSLVINNEDGDFPLDYPEAVITRRLHRNSDAEYVLNKNKTRLSDILLLMARANFGQKSYSVIGQGMVDSFLNATAQERKEFFDEAVGVKQFQIKREQSARKLERTWENLKQAEAIIEEIRPRLNSLTRQVKRLEKRKEVESDLRGTQKKYFGVMWQDLSKQEEDLKPEWQKREKEVSVFQNELSVIQKELSVLEKQDTRTEEFNRLQKIYQTAIEDKNTWHQKEMLLQNQLELSKQRAVLDDVPMATPEIISHLKSIRVLEREVDASLNSFSSMEGLQALQEKFKKLSKQLSELLSNLENPPQKKQEPKEPDKKIVDEIAKAKKIVLQETTNVEHAKRAIDNFNKGQDQQKGKFFELQRAFQEKQSKYHQASQRFNDLKIEMTKLQTRREDLEHEVKAELGEINWLSGFRVEGQRNMEFLSSETKRLKHQLELIGGIDPEIVEEFEKTKERFDFLEKQSIDLSKSIESLKKVVHDLDETIHKQFDQSFKNISNDFQKYFKLLFEGGKSQLVLLKEDSKELEEEKKLEQAMEGVDPDELPKIKEDEEIKKLFKGKSHKVIRGIEIMATPPGKKLSGIGMLSGGERALTSIALICAIISNNPSPFVVLDEVDAALDEANSERFARIVEELSHKTQFIVITHNRATMARANILYGVTMGDDGVSKLLSLKLEEATKTVI